MLDSLPDLPSWSLGGDEAVDLAGVYPWRLDKTAAAAVFYHQHRLSFLAAAASDSSRDQ